MQIKLPSQSQDNIPLPATPQDPPINQDVHDHCLYNQEVKISLCTSICLFHLYIILMSL